MIASVHKKKIVELTESLFVGSFYHAIKPFSDSGRISRTEPYFLRRRKNIQGQTARKNVQFY